MGKEEKKKTNKRRERERERSVRDWLRAHFFFPGELVQNCTQKN